MEVPCWPSGRVKLDGDVLEFGAGELERVPVANLRKSEAKPKAGRLSLTIELVAAVQSSMT
ncbi:MAG TPA: hypothetical protein VF052_05610 [Solirubrobacterales bacterium]